MGLQELYSASARELARKHGVTRETIMNRRRRARVQAQLAEAERVRQQADAVDLARAAARERDAAERRARKAEAKADAYRDELVASRRLHTHAERHAEAADEALAMLLERLDVSGVLSPEAHAGLVERMRRVSQQMRDLRKREPWFRRAQALGLAIGSLLPPSVWHALLAGDDVTATFSARAPGTSRETIDCVDREAALVVPDEALGIVRDFLAAYEAAEDTDRDDMVAAFSEQLTQVLY